jgi:hypothetical protein
MACVITAKKKLLPPVKVGKRSFSAAAEIKGELISSLQKQRAELGEDKSPELVLKIQEFREQITECNGKRWLLRKSLDLQAEIKSIEQQIEEIKSGKKLREFDEKMKPILARLRDATENHKVDSSSKFRIMLEDAERIVRKKLTKVSDPIILQHAITADICDDCGVVMQVIASDSLIGCPQCAKTRMIPVVTAVNTAENDFVCNSSYQQKSRLLEWLEFCQAKEYTEPQEDVLQMVMQQLVSTKSTGLEDYECIIALERQNGPYTDTQNALNRLSSKIPNLKDKLQNIKSIVVRAAMQNASSRNKDDRLRKFYEKAPKYAAYIGGYWPLRFSSSQEDRIRKLYMAACPIYDKYRKPSQPNWPGGYAYFLRCVCILLGWDEFCGHFNISAGPKNILEREAMRKKIWSTELNWEFVPSSPPTESYKLIELTESSRKRKRDGTTKM